MSLIISQSSIFTDRTITEVEDMMKKDKITITTIQRDCTTKITTPKPMTTTYHCTTAQAITTTE